MTSDKPSAASTRGSGNTTGGGDDVMGEAIGRVLGDQLRDFEQRVTIMLSKAEAAVANMRAEFSSYMIGPQARRA